MLGSTELIIILVIILVLFGGSRLPSLMEGLGKGLRAFKKASNEDDQLDLKPKERLEARSSKEVVEVEPAEVEGRPRR